MSIEESQSRQGEQTTQATRTQRARLEWLDRILSRCGFIRSHDMRLNADNEITGHLKAPARLLRQSLAPVLKARDLSYTTLERPGEPRGTDGVVTVRVYEKP
jgi:hypothetical protein